MELGASVMNEIPHISLGARKEPSTTSGGSLLPLLHQIQYGLDQLQTLGEPCFIDLSSLPLAPAEQTALLDFLGVGEVQISIHNLGGSKIWESRFSGVWVVEHLNEQGDCLARHLEIANFPYLARSQAEDIAFGLEQLEEGLKTLADAERGDTP